MSRFCGKYGGLRYAAGIGRKRQREVISRARAACKGSLRSLARPWVGLASRRPTTSSPPPAMAASNSTRERKPRSSAKSDRISQASPCGDRWDAKPARKPRSIRLSGSYTAFSSGVAGPPGKPGRIADDKLGPPRREKVRLDDLDRRSQPQPPDIVRGAGDCPRIIVGRTYRSTPRRASTAASTPVPVPMSKAEEQSAGSGAVATRSTYSPRTGAKTQHSADGFAPPSARPAHLSCAIRGRRSRPAVHAATRQTPLHPDHRPRHRHRRTSGARRNGIR
jgi:hypothetical protein